MNSRAEYDFLSHKNVMILLIIVLALAFVLRIWGNWFGLPYIFHNDETNEVVRALQLGAGQFNFQRIDKGLYFYFLFIEYGALFVVLKVLGVVGSSTEFAQLFIQDPTLFYLVGRTTTAVLGSVTVYVAYRLGRLAYSAEAGLIAALILALNVLHAHLSHFVTVDVPMTLMMLAALYFAVQIARHGNVRHYRWAALFAALAMAAKISAILVIVPLLLAHFLYVRGEKSSSQRYIFSLPLVQAMLIVVSVYVALTPGIAVHFGDVFARYVDKFVGSEIPSNHVADDVMQGPSFFATRNLFVYYADVVRQSMSTPLLAICLLGTGYALWRRRIEDLVLLTFAFVLYVVMSLSNDPFQVFPRYMLPGIPVLALFAGRLLSDVLSYSTRPQIRLGVAAVFLTLMVIPAVQIVSADILMTKKDTREFAKDWIEEQISDGSRIFIEGSRTQAYESTVPLRNSPKNLRRSVAAYGESEPGKAQFFEIALGVDVGITYDLVTVQPTELKDLRHYLDLGVQYFVLRPNHYANSRNRYHWPKLVEDLRAHPEIRLLQRFEPVEKERPGPLIELYGLVSQPNADFGDAE